ncbi:hypothetical protein [Undibacter mobilis]|uniref:Uncharacterized protein n=1 Tax=Undibacter mobilis TaxID=2292256 RepID=A0A371B774_9BRAD|nr:hypothetical protein [Undibacter mobilis]RDV03293.1 hypothetical protein DXH78_01040 [Undibacter mobilis]
MDTFEYSLPGNIIPIDGKLKDGGRDTARQSVAEAGSKDDPRMKEAMRLMEAFLAIEDPSARNALLVLAQQLVSHDWARRVTQG